MDATMRHPPGAGGAAAPSRSRSTATGGSGLFTLLWLVFLAVLIFDPARLDAVWTWFRELPVVGQVAGWVLLLPLVVALAVWEAPWALWIRVTLVIVLAVANLIVFAPKNR